MFMSRGRTAHSPTDRRATGSLRKWRRDHGAEPVAMAATGRLHQSRHDGGFELCVINPRRWRRFAALRGHMAKTDRVDAEVLARLGGMFADLRPVAPRGEFLENLEDLRPARKSSMRARRCAWLPVNWTTAAPPPPCGRRGAGRA